MVKNKKTEGLLSHGVGMSKARLLSLIFLGSATLLLLIWFGYQGILAIMPTSKKLEESNKTVRFQEAPADLGVFADSKIDGGKKTSQADKKTPKPIKPDEKTENPKEALLKSRLISAINEPQISASPTEITKPKVKVLDNIDYLLLKGTKIPCVLETNIISERVGMTSCVITQDIYSSNARILLVEKGSKVTGKYKAGLNNGQRRLEVAWDRIITPFDIAIEVNSPMSGRLGAVGATGKVDNRWFTRIGSALLVSLLDDAIQYATSKQGDNQVIIDSGTSDTTQDIAESILEKNIDLPPIVYLQQGQLINIMVANDIDFSDVYEVN